MVTRKPVPNAFYAGGGSGLGSSPGGSTPDGTPDGQPQGLRPGVGKPAGGADGLSASAIAFEGEEEEVWRQQPQPREQVASSVSAALPETNPFKKKPLASTTGTTTGTTTTTMPPLVVADAGRNPWQPEEDERRPSPAPKTARPESNLLIFEPGEEAESAAWDEVASASASSTLPPERAPPLPPAGALGSKAGEESEEAYESRHAWDDVGGNSGKRATTAVANPLEGTEEAAGEGWSLVDEQVAPGQLSRQSTWENFTDDEEGNESRKAEKGGKKGGKDGGKEGGEEGGKESGMESGKGKVVATTETWTGEAATAKPVNSISVSPPEVAKKPHQQAPVRSLLDIDDSGPPPPPRPASGDKTETYQIKKVRWHDAKAAKNPRVSPILVQNKNGPCPLVALVNALTLTTPADVQTALVDTLRSREQVSLALLLDAVFDELMFARQGAATGALPDVDELYSFLKGLHTGMNVNPRFIPTAEDTAAVGRTSLGHVHPTARSDRTLPGTFEETREMQLYATFGIQLIHGWLPSRDEAVYGAMERHAASYDSVQTLLFREEELDQKLSSTTGAGLTETEQALYQDILHIKAFLGRSATQLTAFGLEVLAASMQPGAIAILFRNDHFSTLYRHPQTMQLLALVTDAGYAGHDEIVWETLVDVNGERAEFYSGDFRLVGGAGAGAGAGAGPSDGTGVASSDRQTSQERSSEQNNDSNGHRDQGPPTITISLSKHEQEDRDLAFALQLQEEEEERERAEAERRKRESQLSEQFIEQQARTASTGPRSRTPASNAAGGGLYSSAQPVAVSPRRSSAAASSSSSSGGGGGAAGHSYNVGSSLAHARSASSAATTSPARYRGRTQSTSASPQPQQPPQPQPQPPQPQQPQQPQQVRPLVPPLGSTTTTTSSPRPPVHRPADDDDDEAPPSYEQAAKQAPYHPPSEQQQQQQRRQQQRQQLLQQGSPSPPPRPGVYAPQPLIGRQQQQQQQTYQQQQYQQAQMRDRDRDCAVM